MLDLNHPQTAFIFEAARSINALFDEQQKLLSAPSAERDEIFQQCQHLILQLHRLNDERFEAAAQNFEALCEWEAQIRVCCAAKAESGGEVDLQSTTAARHRLEWGFGTVFI